MLATKAGVLALVLMGSAVAGGIGLAGYKMFGPGDADKTGGNLSLFAPRTQTAADPNAAAPVNADGSSASLNFAKAAADKDKAAEDAAAAAAASASAAAPTDNTAGDQISGANDEAGYGLFTYNLLQGLNGAAKDAQGQVTLKSLYGYLKPRVQDDARRGNREQTPQLQSVGGEDLILRAK